MRIVIYTRVFNGEAGDREPSRTAAGLRRQAGLGHRSRPCGRDHRLEEREGSTTVQAPVRTGVAARDRLGVVLGAGSVFTRGRFADAAVPATPRRMRSGLALVHRSVPRLNRKLQRRGDPHHGDHRQAGEHSAVGTRQGRTGETDDKVLSSIGLALRMRKPAGLRCGDGENTVSRIHSKYNLVGFPL